MLKLLFWLLLIGNAALFAMQRGYLGATAAERHEPKRLAQQLHPETLTILPANSEKLVTPAKADAPDAAVATADIAKDRKPDATPPETKAAADPDPVAPPAPVVACTEMGNFNAVEVRKFDIQLSSLNLAIKPTTRSVQEAASHMVYIPSQDGKEGAERKSAELRRLGIQDFYVMPESQPNPALRWAISLGVFKTEEAAKAYIGRLIPQGVRSARIMARNVTSNKQAYQWRNVDAATKTALDGLKAKFPNQEMRNCPG
ncbi:hypothetical protein F506_02900 [Herbaspirillum hiltneri N3]|uniref:Sporulation related protein n=1 Tax=Herbaspirillum hiltneri N3 TaxID=1262470 RepID=A0ABM5UX39_9BURK|nr:hypothetical protein [Herbaspirillum hiltneri]AKZ61754.1 hypothetical protein F506_02900 [Herbaspirillum hiltneri N3]